VRIDHVLLAVTDLDTAAEKLRQRYGLTSVAGGTHPQWGTANRIVPLGGQYLEIIGIGYAALAAESPFGTWIRTVTADGDILAGLMMQPDDFDATCARLSLTPTRAERTRPDGRVLSWRLAGVTEAVTRTVPCFIGWDARDELFDGDAGVGARGIASVELGGDADEIATWLGEDVDALRLVGGAPRLHQLTIATDRGDIILGERPFEG
jgi:hypothetical protein